MCRSHIGQISGKQARALGNLATKYFRKMFTLKDGTPMINYIDVSRVDSCHIIRFALAGAGQFGEFHFDQSAVFSWKYLVTWGLNEDQLIEFMDVPLTSVKFMPSDTGEAITQRPGNTCSKAVTWSWIFEREDGSWISLEPGLKGLKMKMEVSALADHSRRRKMVGTSNVDFLYGGLEDEEWKKHLVEELSSGRMTADIELRQQSELWSTTAGISQIEAWLHDEFVKAGKLCVYTQDGAIVLYNAGGTTANTQPSDTHMHAPMHAPITSARSSLAAEYLQSIGAAASAIVPPAAAPAAAIVAAAAATVLPESSDRRPDLSDSRDLRSQRRAPELQPQPQLPEPEPQPPQQDGPGGLDMTRHPPRWSGGPPSWDWQSGDWWSGHSWN